MDAQNGCSCDLAVQGVFTNWGWPAGRIVASKFGVSARNTPFRLVKSLKSRIYEAIVEKKFHPQTIPTAEFMQITIGPPQIPLLKRDLARGRILRLARSFYVPWEIFTDVHNISQV